MDEIALKRLIVDVKKEALKKGFRLALPTLGTSMSPLIKSQDKVVIIDCDKQRLKCADLILYQANGNNNMIAHRLVRKVKDKSSPLFITKGDASLYCDKPVSLNQVMGKIIKVKKRHFTISLDGLAGETINMLLLLISLTRIIPVSYIVLRKMKYLLRG